MEEIVKILHYKSNDLTGFYNWLSKKEAADMSERKLENMDYSAVQGDPDKEQFHVRDERFGFIDKRLVPLYSE